MPRFRRTTRRRFRRRIRPRRLLRKAGRLKKIAFRIKRKKEKFRDRKRRHNKYGYMYGAYNSAAKGRTGNWDISNNATEHGLGNASDVDKCFDNIRQLDDIIFAAGTQTNPQLKANRGNLTMWISAKATYTLTNLNSAGGSFVQVYVCRPRKDISTDGIGTASGTTPGAVFNSNLNSTLLADYNDAAGFGITGGQIDNTFTQAKPSAVTGEHWITPFMVPEFTQTWKVLKVIKTFIPAGGSFMFTIRLPRTKINRQDYQRGGTAVHLEWLRKFSKQVFLRHHGQPNNDDTTATLVNYDESNLAAVVNKKYEFSYGHQPQYFTFRGTDSNMGTLTTTAFPGEAEEKVEDAGGGA